MQIVSYNNPEEKSGSDFKQFFNNELRKILWSEMRMQELTPFLIKQSLSEDLVKELSLFFLRMEKEIIELEEVFSLLELRMEEMECDITKGFFDAAMLTSCTTRGKVRDAAIVLIIQKVISFQVVSLRTISMYLRRMKMPDAAQIVEGILAEKKKSDKALYNLSAYINYASMSPQIYKQEILEAEY